MGVPIKYFTFQDSQADVGKLTAARLNGDFDPLYACLDPATGGLEDTNVKAGAKIVCTDRAHTVTGVWTFTTAPVLPAGSIADSKLTSNVMLKTTYDADLDGVVDSAANADTVDGSHASAFAVASYITSGTLDGDRLPALSTTKKGGVPATGTPSGKFLKDDNTWALTGGYALCLTALTFNPADAATYYVGIQAEAPTTVTGHRLYVPQDGTIKAAYVNWNGSAPSNEGISMYIRLNNATDTLIATVGTTSVQKLFSNNALSIAVVAGDYIELKIICPTWVTNPAGVILGGSVYIE